MATVSPLLAVPAEIRAMIWAYTMDPVRIHVLRNGVTTCNRELSHMCEGPSQCHAHDGSRDLRCERCPRVQWPQWFQCCRLVYDETQTVRDRRTTISFASSHVLRHVMQRSPSRLKRYSQIHLHLGPAKFGQRADRTAARQALYVLLCAAIRLHRLHLTLGFYHQAWTDRVMLDNNFLDVLIRFRNLESLRLEMGRPPPGPVGGIHGPRTMASLSQRLALLESVLGRYLCQSKDMEAGIERSCLTVAMVRKEVIALIEPHSMCEP